MKPQVQRCSRWRNTGKEEKGANHHRVLEVGQSRGPHSLGFHVEARAGDDEFCRPEQFKGPFHKVNATSNLPFN